MPIRVSYFGKQDPKTATAPVSSYQWDKPPFGEEAKIDWKTGKVRSALFQEEKPVDNNYMPFMLKFAGGGLSVWLPHDKQDLVKRDGVSVQIPAEFVGVGGVNPKSEKGWLPVNLAGASMLVPFSVFVKITDASGSPPAVTVEPEDMTWAIVAKNRGETTFEDSDLLTPVLIGVVDPVKHTIIQAHVGEVATYSNGLLYSEVCPAVITGGSSASGYTVNLYANGIASASTGTATLFLPEAACESSIDLPSGTAVLAHYITANVTGGG